MILKIWKLINFCGLKVQNQKSQVKKLAMMGTLCGSPTAISGRQFRPAAGRRDINGERERERARDESDRPRRPSGERTSKRESSAWPFLPSLLPTPPRSRPIQINGPTTKQTSTEDRKELPASRSYAFTPRLTFWHLRAVHTKYKSIEVEGCESCPLRLEASPI